MEEREPLGAPRLVATLTEAPSADGREIAALPPETAVLEVRGDLLGEAQADLQPEALRRHFDGELLYTLRSREEGGRSNLPPEERQERLARAAGAGWDLLDLEGNRDLHAPVLEEVPPERRLISWHGPTKDLEGLSHLFERLEVVDARYYKIIPVVSQPGEEVAPLQLLHALGRRDVVAFAAGEVGLWTRLVAPRLGSPLVYGSAGDDPAAPGQPSVARLVSDYGPTDPRSVEALMGIVGDPVAHSLSPRLHNGAYRELGLPYLYLPFHTTSFGDFWLEVVENPNLEVWGLPLTGLSVTSPYKAPALAVAGATSPLAEWVGGANTLVLHDGVWEAETTDPQGVVGPLEEHGVEIEGRRAAVLGAGGAGRAAVVGLGRAGAEVTLVNRSRERGKRAAEALEVPFVPMDEADWSAFDLVVQATPLGASDDDPLPFEPEELSPSAVVVDMVYRDRPTALVAGLRRLGRPVVEGREMLLHQAFAQFERMTGRELPPELGRRLLELPRPELWASPRHDGHDETTGETTDETTKEGA